MNVHWKELGQRAHPRRWSGMAWGVVLMVMLFGIGTAVVGFKLVEMADRQQVEFDNG